MNTEPSPKGPIRKNGDNAIPCPECDTLGVAWMNWHTEKFICTACGATGTFSQEKAMSLDPSLCYAARNGEHLFIPSSVIGDTYLTDQCQNPGCGWGGIRTIREADA